MAKVITNYAVKRLISDIKDLKKNNLSKEGIFYEHDESNIMNYSSYIMNLNKEVCGIIGWAVWSVIKVLKNAKVHSHDTAQQIQFLNNMRYTHSEAMENNDYMNNHYSMFDMLRNCDGLSFEFKFFANRE